MADEAMIAYLPEYARWVKQDLPHMTLVYCGPVADLQESDFNAMGKDAIAASWTMGPFSLQVTGVEEFGDNEKVDVVTFYPTPQLLLARKIVEKWNKSEFDFSPHMTIGPAGSAFEMNPNNDPYADTSSYTKNSIPRSVYFNRIAVCWGPKRLVFNLSSG